MNLQNSQVFDLLDAPMSVVEVSLLVHDLDRMTRFYCDLLGLTVFSQDATATRLGVEQPFLTLSAPGGLAASAAGFAGLYHTAFLLPSREALGAWVDHAQSKGVRFLGAADHGVSEAIYLVDPEGNGIEVYADRPIGKWFDNHGRLQMTTGPLATHSLPQTSWEGAPSKTRIGHVHLQTPDLVAAEAFWRDAGFDITMRGPGVLFWGAGGYHHQIATNIWSRGPIEPRHDGLPGLAEVTLRSATAPDQTLTAPSGVRIKITSDKG